MSAWWLLPLALAACLAVVAIAACLSPKPYVGRHLAVVPDPEPAQDFYGSMSLDAEPGAPVPLPRIPYWPAPDWREQTAADLSPEALANDTGRPDPYIDAMAAEAQEEFDAMMFDADPSIAPAGWRADSGLGAPSSGSDTPGPAQMSMLPDQEQPEVSPGQGDDLRILTDALAPAPEAIDSGAGPGSDWLDGQLAVLYEWVRAQYAAAAA